MKTRMILLRLGLFLALSSRQLLAADPVPVGNGDSVFHPGPTGYASLASSSVQGLNYQTNLTVEVALNIEANAAGGRWPIVLGKMYSPPHSYPGFALSINQGQFKTVGQQICAAVADGSSQAALASRSFQGTVHAVMTWNAGTKELKLYVNGALEASKTNALDTVNLQNSYDLKLAGTSIYGQTLQRDILFARLWNRFLTSNEVSSVWSQFSSSGQHALPPAFDRRALVSEWLMDATSTATGTPGTTHLKDSQGRNHLQLQGAAFLWQGLGPLVLQSPQDGTVNVSKSVTLKATGGASALGTNPVRPLQYQFQVDELNTFDSPALRDSGWLVHYGAWKPILKPATQYFWRVRVKDSSPAPTISSFAATSSFTTKVPGTWYVRPGTHSSFDAGTGAPTPTGGVYGRQDGTSYADAWNGLYSVVWGELGVEAGDTLYVCGRHLYTAANANFLADQAKCKVTASGFSDAHPITLRMDWPESPGEVWGAFIDNSRGEPSWQGPDANGVYSTSGLPYGTGLALTDTNITLLDREHANTWIAHPGAAFLTNGIWYVKMPDGSNPRGKILSWGLGYRFDLGRSHFVRFLNCQFYNAAPAKERVIHAETTIPVSTHIVFDGCELRYAAELELFMGHDDWTVRNSVLRDSMYGVYTMLNDGPIGANRLTVSGCHIYQMGTELFPHQDAHGIGVQGGEGHLLEHNWIEDTGAAIEFWTASQPMKNHLIQYNFIRNIYVKSITGGGGIVISGDNTYSVIGLRTGFRIYGNIIQNTGLGATESWQGAGISSNCRDYIDICNNSIYYSTTGISLGVINAPAQARIANNIIVSPSFRYIQIIGSSTSTNLLIDYNLFYPITVLSDRMTVYPSISHDQHSIFADPLFVSSAPATAPEFRLRVGSRAIDAGLNVGLTQDFDGNAIPQENGPDIGAHEFTGIRPIPPRGLQASPGN